MDTRLAALESGLRDLAARVHELERQIADLEAARVVAPDALRQGTPPQGQPPSGPAVRHTVLADTISLAGRSLVVLGGAYLLRALTDAGTLAPATGITLGLAYATLWIVAADRTAAAGGTSSAIFHALTAAFIFFPLLWEGTTRFHVLTPAWSACVLAAASAVTLLVALRTRLQTLAITVVVGALPASVALIAATGSLLPFAVFLIALGLATLWLGYEREWTTLRWPVALVADLAAVGLAVRAVGPHPLDAPVAAIAVQILLLGGYLTMIGARTVVRARDVIPFEVAQTIGALIAGLGAAAYVAAVTGADAGLLGFVTTAFGIGSYALAFVFIDRRQRTNFYFYTSLALIYVVSGTELVLRTPAVSVVWAALAVAAAWLSGRLARVTLSWHAVAYASAAAIGSGLLAHATWAWTSRMAGAWQPIGPDALIALAAIGISIIAPMPRERRANGAWTSAARLALVALLAWTAGGAFVAWLTVQAGSSREVTMGLLATLRTGVLALTALALGLSRRVGRVSEGSSLVYPVLCAGALKVIVEDFPRSTPATLFAALAVYGAALIVAPRLLRGAGTSPAPTAENAAVEVPENRHAVCDEPAARA